MSLSRKNSAQSQLILGALDHIDNGIIQGWALDRLNPHTPLPMRVTIDGNLTSLIDCDLSRPDLSHLHLPAAAVGFDYRVPKRFHDGQRHVLAFSTLAAEPIALPGPANNVLHEIHFVISSAQAIDGIVDGLVDGMIQGWALKFDNTGIKTGGVRLLLSVDSVPMAELTADHYRADLAGTGEAEAACGFVHALPPDFYSGRKVRLEVHAMPGRIALRNSPMEIFLPAEPERGRISALIERADELFRFAHHLRQELRAALPVDRYSLADYPAWAARNQPLIAPRAAARYGPIAGTPLVSILCPVFRPDPAEFLTTIDSVRSQTYPNWELLLVDDGSADQRLQQIIASLAQTDRRIRPLTQPQNTGISAATNRALAAVNGKVCIWLDHTDVLDGNAVEIMLRARSATGAQLLYSDEDKIDRAAKLCEPNFKPDFNPRLLLDQNYICHLLMVETDLAQKIGFDSRFDGAQDHDFLLRLTEQLQPDQIHHVAEMLYHWRISDSSTARNGLAKPFAGKAGAAAVTAHLRRRNLTAKTVKRGNLICYRTDFTTTDDPGISILIPFRDHIGLTGACVDAIRASAAGLRHEIILLDNWSNGTGAESFCVTQSNLADTTVIRIAEPFNYSRINNIGAAAAKYPYLLFLNNDVLVQNNNWLRVMLNEVLADPQTGAVGAKLLYPNGTVQHAGVVLGIGGVADHAFRGLHSLAPGYMGHAICAREVAAVTAACMLVRRSAFDAVSGFDETDLGIAFNDIDLCLKLRAAGHRIIFNPDAVAEHHESMSRGDDLTSEKLARFMRENQTMLERWRHLLAADPFYNRHFARDGGLYRDLRVLNPAAEPPYLAQQIL